MPTDSVKDRIKTLGFSSSDELILNSYLKILEDSLAEKLDHSRQNNIQTVLIDVDTDAGRLAWENKENNPSNKVYVAYTAQFDKFPAEYCLSKPVRGRELLQLFEDITNHSTDTLNKATDNRYSIEFVPQATPQNTILNLLLSPIVERPVKFRSFRTPDFIIDKPRQSCFLSSELTDLMPLANLDANMIEALPLSFEELNNIEKKSQPLPLQQFFWFAALHFSSGRLLPEPRKLQKFGLSHWPDFNNLPHETWHERLATYMMTRPGSLENLRKQAKIDIKSATAFINACYICGYLKDTNIRYAGVTTVTPQHLKKSAKSLLRFLKKN